MAKYTIELGDLITAKFDLDLQHYPIFDETYRATLNAKILDHYRFREIGFETPARFKSYLNRTMNEIMPLYNQYYSSAKLQFNPMYNMDYAQDGTTSKTGNNNTNSTNNITDNVDVTTHDTYSDSLKKTGTDTLTKTGTDALTKTGTDSSDSDSTSHLEGSGTKTNNLTKDETLTPGETETTTKTHWDKFSETPQGSVTNLENDTYLSNARKVTDTDSVAKSGSNHNVIKDTGTVGDSTTEDGTSGNVTTVTHNTTDTETHNTTDTTTHDTTDTTTGSKDGTIANDRAIKKTDEIIQSHSENGTLGSTFKGINGVSGSELLLKYRQTFVNIDMMIINELADLFMNIY
jgi:hypothetical protein